MTNAREVIAEVVGEQFIFDRTPDLRLADAIIAALDADGLGIIDRSKFKTKLNAKSMKYLDEMAEAQEAMDGKPALRLLLEHYRAMVGAAKDE